MLAKVYTCAVLGLEGRIIEVEVDISPGLPSVTVVGLGDKAVQESRERVRAAVRNCGCDFPLRRVTVNLAPADLRKEGPAYDLAIAVGVLLSTGQVSADLSDTALLGELALDGLLRHTNGILPMVDLARQEGFRRVVVPEADAREASLVAGIEVLPAASLADLVAHLWGDAPLEPASAALSDGLASEHAAFPVDLRDIKGQEHAKFALEVAAAGGHNVLMMGPPGSGKTLLARSLPSILPGATPSEALEVTKIYSISGLLPSDTPLITQRPFRAPHYTTSHAGLVGGGHWPRPGEVTLAHRGVLFLDELPEFGQSVLEVLRQPIEDKAVTISRAQGRVTFPANFMLIGAMNPCPCGYYGDPFRACTCNPSAVARYRNRISGPLLDRIDVILPVPRVDYEKLTADAAAEDSAQVRRRVEAARERQRRRFGESPVQCNADMGPSEVWQHCRLDDATQAMAKAAMDSLHLSARAYHRTLKLARTIADLADDGDIGSEHFLQAMNYRQRDEE
ncbi:MAG: YifB family Mg chelatase-like AAA ATPase [Chloroflexota bacterium]|nr:YifB family Mg chelatase-like AAA ATPase [Chloroflexota bacterium]